MNINLPQFLKNIGYLSVFMTFFMLSGGFLLVYKIQQYLVQKEMHNVLNNKLKDSEKLTLSNSDYQNNKIDSHEILVQGKLYDIRSVIRMGNIVELQVINDSREEKILDNIKDLVNNSSNSKNHLPEHLLKWLNLVFICPGPVNSLVIKYSSSCFLPFNELIISHKTDLWSPPPKLC